MLLRLKHYVSQLKRLLANDGWHGALTTSVKFLIRRKFFLQFAAETFEYQVLSRFRPLGSTLIELHPTSQKPCMNRWAFYVTYSQNSQIAGYVINQVKALSESGYEVLLISSSPQIPDHEIQKVSPFCRAVLHRQNRGYDFASWATGYQVASENPAWAASLKEAESVILMNDSCFGPYQPLGPILERMRAARAAVFGISKCYELGEYIQSYFMHFGSELIKKGVLADYIRRIRILHTKWGIVRFFEIGGSRWLNSQGFELMALVDPREPEIAQLLTEFSESDPVRDPVGKALIERKLSPFHKRSNSTPPRTAASSN